MTEGQHDSSSSIPDPHDGNHHRKPVRPVISSYQRGWKIDGNGVLTIYITGSERPHCVVKPGYNVQVGPHISFHRVNMNGEEEPAALILGLNGLHALVQKLPLLAMHARRMERNTSKKQRG